MSILIFTFAAIQFVQQIQLRQLQRMKTLRFIYYNPLTFHSHDILHAPPRALPQHGHRN